MSESQCGIEGHPDYAHNCTIFEQTKAWYADSFVDTVSVHPETVTKVSRGELRPMPKPSNKRGKPARTVRSMAYTQRMHQELWRVALELADYDRSRIEVKTETEVVVHNNADWRA